MVPRIFNNSFVFLSWETIVILSALFLIDSKQLGSIANDSFDAKYAALIILNGSSENVVSESRGVLKIFLLRSSIPLNGSKNSPKFSLFNDTAIAFIVKSLLNKSSSILDITTSEGLLEDSSYFSSLAEATSISYSLNGILAVANFLKGTIFGTLIFLANFSAKSIPSPSTIISTSIDSAKGFSIKSRTQPPTKKAFI